MCKLLFVDDDADLLSSNQKYFTREGYQVETAATPQSALARLERYSPDCIILDVMLPTVNGFELFKKIRLITRSPVIFLSGRTGEDDKIKGLLAGGGDYITKPYSLRELAARIQVQIRSASAPSASTISYPPLTLDILAHKAFCRDTEIPLSNLEYQLLYLLVSRPGETVTFEEIGQSVWGYYSDMDRRTIVVHISRLRKKLEGYAGLEHTVETVWAKGYKFVGGRGRRT